MRRNKHMIRKIINNNNNFCFDSKNILSLDLLSKIKLNKVKQQNTATKKEKKENDFFIPSQNDELFWCWYIFKNGIKEYNILTQKYFSIEKNQKIDWIPLLRENKANIKQLKYKLCSLENNLVNEKKMHITTLETICFLNSISFIVIKNKMIYKNIQEDCEDNDMIILKYFPEKNKYGIFLNKKKIF